MYYLSSESQKEVKQNAPKTYEYLKKLENKPKGFKANVVTRL